MARRRRISNPLGDAIVDVLLPFAIAMGLFWGFPWVFGGAALLGIISLGAARLYFGKSDFQTMCSNDNWVEGGGTLVVWILIFIGCVTEKDLHSQWLIIALCTIVFGLLSLLVVHTRFLRWIPLVLTAPMLVALQIKVRRERARS
jgi:hypothetical protein